QPHRSLTCRSTRQRARISLYWTTDRAPALCGNNRSLLRLFRAFSTPSRDRSWPRDPAATFSRLFRTAPVRVVAYRLRGTRFRAGENTCLIEGRGRYISETREWRRTWLFPEGRRFLTAPRHRHNWDQFPRL